MKIFASIIDSIKGLGRTGPLGREILWQILLRKLSSSPEWKPVLIPIETERWTKSNRIYEASIN